MTEHRAVRPIDRSRAARAVLAFLTNDLGQLNRSLMEANEAHEVDLLIAALAEGLGETLVQSIGEDATRQLMDRVILGEQIGFQP
ncbi:hypothetical protein CH293_11515 [Rhodococcus sp. 14-2470-1b]|uniref:hypothetical protein n=1 Tax=Rhodococcus sp. 14-2470-1b TaxID=2023149 RepID=UPI000B9C09AB|nr:hypothetical protein [Rhodococcus sp. 14-2470-1b]OZF53130.1 hypothetical protein CH293_11515 [Rhodococcus sp. 14-2470-1b]